MQDTARIANIVALYVKEDGAHSVAVSEAIRTVEKTKHSVTDHHITVAREAKRAALHQFFVAVEERVYFSVLQLNLRPEDARDVVQTVMEKVIQFDLTKMAIGNLDKYVRRMAINSALDILRVRGRRPEDVLERLKSAGDLVDPNLLPVDDEIIKVEQRRLYQSRIAMPRFPAALAAS